MSSSLIDICWSLLFSKLTNFLVLFFNWIIPSSWFFSKTPFPSFFFVFYIKSSVKSEIFGVRAVVYLWHSLPEGRNPFYHIPSSYNFVCLYLSSCLSVRQSAHWVSSLDIKSNSFETFDQQHNTARLSVRNPLRDNRRTFPPKFVLKITLNCNNLKNFSRRVFLPWEHHQSTIHFASHSPWMECTMHSNSMSRKSSQLLPSHIQLLCYKLVWAAGKSPFAVPSFSQQSLTIRAQWQFFLHHSTTHAICLLEQCDSWMERVRNMNQRVLA